MRRSAVDLQHLRAFIAVAREGNLTRASQVLHLTQSAVSLQLKHFQDALNLQLLARSLRGLSLTASGEQLLPLAERVLRSLDDLEQAANALQETVHGTVLIGTILNPGSIRLSPILQHLSDHHAGITAKLRHGMTRWVLEQVVNGELDAGFYLGFPEEIDPGLLHAVELMQLTFYVIAPKGWQDRIAGKDWKALADLPWIWTPPSSAHHRMLSRAFESARARPTIAAEADLEASMVDLVRAGVGLSLARDSIALSEAQTHGIAVEKSLAISIPMWFIARAARKDDPVIEAVFSAVAAAFE